MAKYAVLTTLEWTDRKKDGTLEVTKVAAGEVTDAIPTESLQALLDGKSIEPYDAKAHKGDWYQRRYNEELDAASVKAGGVARNEPSVEDENGNRNITAGDNGTGGDARE